MVMLNYRWLNRCALGLVLALVIVGVSACYKDAGENMQPTSNRVDLRDIEPTHTVLPPSVTPLSVTVTPTLVATTTPAGVQAEAVSATPIENVVEAPVSDPTLITPQRLSSYTPIALTPTPTEILIVTPDMSDIQASPTASPTTDPLYRPTPTAIPVEENPCIHMVNPNDTLYSIARENEVTVDALIAANGVFLGGNPNTVLQIGWQLQIPGCGEPEPTATSVPAVSDPTTIPAVGEPTSAPVEITPTLAFSFPIEHVVQPGETIYAIGRLYGVDPLKIIAANPNLNPDRIKPEDIVIVPVPE